MPNLNSKRNSSWRIAFIEGIIVFAVLILGFFIESFNRGLLFYQGVFHTEIVVLVLIRSFFITLIFVFTFRFVKIAIPFFDFLKIKKEERETNKYYQRISVLSNVTIILGLILVSMPIRPILQKTFVESDVEDFSYFFAKYDAIPSIIILLAPAVVLIYYILKYRERYMKYIHIIVIFLVIFSVGWVNNDVNYGARISETRKNWIVSDWDKQKDDANKALQAAKSDEEKATAYF